MNAAKDRGMVLFDHRSNLSVNRFCFDQSFFLAIRENVSLQKIESKHHDFQCLNKNEMFLNRVG